MSSASSFSRVIAEITTVDSNYLVGQVIGQPLEPSEQGTVNHLVAGINHRTADDSGVDFIFKFDFPIKRRANASRIAGRLVLVQRNRGYHPDAESFFSFITQGAVNRSNFRQQWQAGID